MQRVLPGCTCGRIPEAQRICPAVRLLETFRLLRRIAAGLVVAGLLLLVAGCADRADNSDNGKNGGFYGGMSGGWSHP